MTHANKRLVMLILLLCAWPSAAMAQAAEVTDVGDAAPPADPSPEDGLVGDPSDEPDEPDAPLMELSLDGEDVAQGGGFLVAGKLGGGLTFSDLQAHPTGALELGYVFGAMDRSFAALLDVSYLVPVAEGQADDARVPGGSYKWKVWQKQLILQPTFLYRFTTLTTLLVPYAGIGPRFYLLETVEEGSADSVKFPSSTEQSTKVGFGIPLGVEYPLGPGALIGEVLLQWGPLDHRITGDSNLGTATIWLGYRAIL